MALLALALVALAGCGAAGQPAVLFLRAGDDGRVRRPVLIVERTEDEANVARRARSRVADHVADFTRVRVQDAPDAAPRALSAQPAGDVLDFALSPDGRRVVYSVGVGPDGGLRLVDAAGGGDRELLLCPQTECSGPVWAPDGARLVYERRTQEATGALASPRLMWLDPASGATIPLIAGEVIGYGARFSPDGAWLSYVSPADEGIVLYHLADGAQRLLSGRTGRPAAFSPDSTQLIVSDIVFGAAEGQESTRVFL